MTDSLALTITQASLNQTAMDWPQNMINHYTAIDIAVDRGSDMVLMPELSLTAYEASDLFRGTDNLRIYEALCDIATYANKKDPDLIVSVGAPWRVHLRSVFEHVQGSHIVKNAFYDRMSKPFNAQVILHGGDIISMTGKNDLYDDERGYEYRNFNEYSKEDADEVATLTGIETKFGTLSILLPSGKKIPMGQPIIYVTDENGHAYAHTQVICETKWVLSRYDGYPYNDSRYEQGNKVPEIQRYLETKEGTLLEVANASPPSKLKQDKHIHLNKLASNYFDVVVDTDGLGNSGSTFAQFGHRHIAQNGEIIAAGERMQFGQVATTTSTVRIKNADPALKVKAHATITRQFKNPAAEQKTSLIWNVKGSGAEWDHPDNPDRWIEEEIRNQALWTYDYMRKVGSTRALNASSGGQDSGFNITMDYAAIILAMHYLGVEGVCDDMNIPYKDAVMDAFEEGGKEAAIKEFMDHYLIMYYMPTNNNPEDHELAARELSEGGVDENGERFEGLGGQFKVRNVQDLVTMCALVFGVENTTEMGEERMQKLMSELAAFVHASPKKYSQKDMKDWEVRLRKEYPELEDMTSVALEGQSIAYENFQARIRTVLIWAASNVHKGSPRANPNLTEGYTNNTTAAGDLQGGAFNPNGGMFKDEEQAVLRYLEEKGVHGVIPPIKALRRINNNEPTAGLLPQEEGQTDEKTMQASMKQLRLMALLMHHSRALTEYGERELNFGEVYNRVKEDPEFSELDENEQFNTVANFYRRWYSGQFKIHMGTIQRTMGRSVDHQTSRRTPNLNGGQKDEIILAAIDQMYQWAGKDGVQWSENERRILEKRAWQDLTFAKQFMREMVNTDPDLDHMHYNLRDLYDRLKTDGWDNIFTPLENEHPILSLHN